MFNRSLKEIVIQAPHNNDEVEFCTSSLCYTVVEI